MLIHLRTVVWTLKALLWAPVIVWFYSLQGSYFILSRMGNKIIYQLDDLIKEKTSCKSSRSNYKCSYFALFCCQVSNSSHLLRRSFSEAYVIFFCYRGRWNVMSENFFCVYKYKKGFPFKRLWDTKNPFFCQMEFYYR